MQKIVDAVQGTVNDPCGLTFVLGMIIGGVMALAVRHLLKVAISVGVDDFSGHNIQKIKKEKRK